MALGYGTLLASQVTDGTANTAGTAASMLNPTAVYTFPPNYFGPANNGIGKSYHIYASGRISNVITSPGTARYDIRMGSTVVFDTTAMNLNVVAKVNVNWILNLWFTVRAIGSSTSANIFCQGTWQSESVIASPLPTVGGSGMFTLPYNSAPAAGAGFDSTAAKTLDVFFTQSLGTGSHTCHDYYLFELN